MVCLKPDKESRDVTASAHKFKIACVQLCTGRDRAANMVQVTAFIREAADQGADLIVTPEMTAMMEGNTKELFAHSSPQAEDESLKEFCALARDVRSWLVIGSLAIKVTADKLANRSFVISPEGEIVANYDKIHMFDVSLPDGEVYRESRNYLPGTQTVAVDLPWGRMGLSVCYDLRFPTLYRALAQAGADFLAIPSAFTVPTGEAHWQVLLRARAIENGCYVFAPAQDGVHENGRKTYGHSLIVSPWGEVLAQASPGLGLIFADIDLEQVKEARRRIPSLDHDRDFVLSDPSFSRSVTAS